MEMTNVLDLIQNSVEGSKAVNVVAIVKEGLSSRELVHHAKNYDFLKKQIQTNAQMYSNLAEPFDTYAFAESFNGTSTYTLQTLEELSTLSETI
jgi:hypothetical protein